MRDPSGKEQRPQTHQEVSINAQPPPLLRLLRNSLRPASPSNSHDMGEGSELPLVSVPDIALEIVLKPADINVGADQLRAQLQAAISGGLSPGSCMGGRMHLDSDVRLAKRTIKGTNGISIETTIFGIWLDPAPSLGSKDAVARDRGVQNTALLSQTVRVLPTGDLSESFGWFLSSSLIESKALDCWNTMPLKRFNRNGQLDNRGPIHLVGLSVHFDADATAIITEIEGLDTDIWPSVHFSIDITDALSSAGTLHVVTAVQMYLDPALLAILTPTAAAVSKLAWPLATFFDAETIITRTRSGLLLPGAVGRAIASEGIPDEILLTGKVKLSVKYYRLHLGAGGLVAKGRYTLKEENPK